MFPVRIKSNYVPGPGLWPSEEKLTSELDCLNLWLSLGIFSSFLCLCFSFFVIVCPVFISFTCAQSVLWLFLGHSVFLILQPPCGCSTASVLYHEVSFGLKSLIVPVARLIPCLDLGPLVKNHHDCLKKKINLVCLAFCVTSWTII